MRDSQRVTKYKLRKLLALKSSQSLRQSLVWHWAWCLAALTCWFDSCSRTALRAWGFLLLHGDIMKIKALKLGVTEFEGCNSGGKCQTFSCVMAAQKGISVKSSHWSWVCWLQPRGAAGAIPSVFPFYSLSLIKFSWAVRWIEKEVKMG